MKPVIYSTRKAATSGTPINVTRDWETVLVQFNDFIVTETRTCSSNQPAHDAGAKPRPS